MAEVFTLTRRALLLSAASMPLMAAKPLAGGTAGLVEPRMRLAAASGRDTAPAVAVTLDACDGGCDLRILDLLIAEAIPATVFVSGLWLRANPGHFQTLLAHPDLFEIGDHGARHEAAIDRPMLLWKVVHAAGSLPGVAREVGEGAALLEAAGAPRPKWYRAAAALYSPEALRTIVSLGYRVAGFSLNADAGASLGQAETARRIAAARDGDVLIAHLNQPLRPAGAGVAEGLKVLKEKGVRFLRLSDPAAVVVAEG